MSDLVTGLLMCRSTAASGLGGPVWRVRAMLKELRDLHPDNVTLRGVLCDGLYTSVEALPPLMRPTPVTDAKLRAAANFVGTAAASVPNLLHNLRTAVAQAPGDIVFDCHDFVSTYMARRVYGHRHPALLTIHAKGGGAREALLDYPLLGKTPVAGLMTHIEDTAVSSADIVVFPSAGASEHFADYHPGLLDGKRVETVYAGIDPATLAEVPDDPTLRQRFEVGADEHLIVSIAAMVQDKGLDTLVDAFAALPAELRNRSRCLIVARDGPLRPAIEAKIAEYGLQERVRLLGFLSREDMVRLLRDAQAFALPSRVAIFDVVHLEAMAVRTPVVTTTVGGNLEMFNPDAAYLVPPDDAQAVANALTQVFDAPEAAAVRAEAAYQRLRTDFTLDAMFYRYLGLYGDLLHRPMPQAPHPAVSPTG